MIGIFIHYLRLQRLIPLFQMELYRPWIKDWIWERNWYWNIMPNYRGKKKIRVGSSGTGEKNVSS